MSSAKLRNMSNATAMRFRKCTQLLLVPLLQPKNRIRSVCLHSWMVEWSSTWIQTTRSDSMYVWMDLTSEDKDEAAQR
eukprot:4761391-Pyramimonas_sp.AAC.1